jgi:thioredoxin reductase
MHDLIIIGGGPAGLTATIYALRKRLNMLLVSKDLGGKTNYRLQLPEVDHHLVINGEEVVSRFMNEIEYLDFARVLDTVDRVERVPDGYAVYARRDQVFTARSLIFATGARARKLNVPGERDFWMRGLCYSAVSYAPLFVDRTVVVIGDTGLALRAAAELARTAKHVMLVAPTPGDFDNPLGQRLRTALNVTILEGYRVERVSGPNYAHSLTLVRDNAHHEVVADAFFVELGLIPNSDLVAGLVNLDAEGRIKVDARNRTSAPGLFAAGDVTNAYAEQVLIAVGEGAKAALSAYEYLLSLPIAESESALPKEWR